MVLTIYEVISNDVTYTRLDDDVWNKINVNLFMKREGILAEMALIIEGS